MKKELRISTIVDADKQATEFDNDLTNQFSQIDNILKNVHDTEIAVNIIWNAGLWYRSKQELLNILNEDKL